MMLKRGIEVDSNKDKEITNISPPKNLKKLRILKGNINYDRR